MLNKFFIDSIYRDLTPAPKQKPEGSSNTGVRYSNEFRCKIVSLAKNGISIPKIAKEYSLYPTTVHRFIQKYEDGGLGQCL